MTVESEFLNEYDRYEDGLIRKFNETDFYSGFGSISKEKFTDYVLQLGHISSEFVKFIEVAKLAVKLESGKEAVRSILRDEIPAVGPTHQDNRFSDLRKIGLTEEQILNTPKSKATARTIKNYYKLVGWPQSDYDLKVLITLRVLGEVLVGETYKYVVQGLQKNYGLRPEDSLFYSFHWKHDQKGGQGDEGGSGHTEYYDQVLGELITDKEKLKVAKKAALAAYKVRCKFNEQFL
jgi:hypothetical protein